MNRAIRIGTRGSDLALWQARFVADELAKYGHSHEIIIIKTKGDGSNLAFNKMEGKGFFTKELEEALLGDEIDLAVHSMKDIPTEQTTGLTIAGVSIRQDPADWLLIDPKCVDKEQILHLPLNANVGTSSVRRKSQLLDIRPDLMVNDLRGNVPTRVQKLRQGEYQGIVLAAAGIQRLNLDLSDLIVFPLHPREFVPAPAQGVLAYQCKKDNKEIREIVKAIHQTETARLTNIERKVLQMMDGGCQVPIGVYCETDHFGHYHVWAAYSANENEPLHRIRHSSSTSFELAETIVRLLKSGQSA